MGHYVAELGLRLDMFRSRYQPSPNIGLRGGVQRRDESSWGALGKGQMGSSGWILRWGNLSKTYLVGGVSVLDNTVGTDNDTVDVVMLHQRTEHSVAYPSAIGHNVKVDLQIMVAGI